MGLKFLLGQGNALNCTVLIMAVAWTVRLIHYFFVINSDFSIINNVTGFLSKVIVIIANPHGHSFTVGGEKYTPHVSSQ